MSVGEYEHEPVRGLPEYLPEGEELVWQGEPDRRSFARRVFHTRKVLAYFLVLIAVHLALQLRDGSSVLELASGSSWMLGLGLLALCILHVLAWAYARSTIYTLTDKRLVLRFGVAVPMMINLPLSIIRSADMRRHSDGSGDIVLTLEQRKRLSYMMLWPNARPWKFSPPLPALRCVPEVERVAECLAAVAGSEPSPVRQEASIESAEPQFSPGPALGAS